MFPKTTGRLPGFVDLDLSDFKLDHEAEESFNLMLHQHQLEIEQSDINVLLKIFKKDQASITNKFINAAVSFYFSHPQVIASLQGGRKSLFPHYRPLAEIDYDLLIPVVEKAEENE